jgi:hypothetical protein
MIARKLSPVIWCKWRFDMWERMGSEGAPSFDWVFAASGMEKHHGWFHADTTAECSSRVLPFSDKFRALALKHMQLGRARTERELVELWERLFPGDSFVQAIAEVSEENRAAQAKINADVKAGAYLW